MTSTASEIVPRRTWAMVSLIARRYPFHAVATVLALLLSGLLEGVGLAVLLPLLTLFVRGTDEIRSDDVITQSVTEALSFVSVAPTLEVMIALFVLTMLVKALFSISSTFVVAHTGQLVVADMRKRLSDGILSARWDLLIDMPAGRIASAMGTEAGRGGNGYVASSKFAASVIRVVILTGVALMISWQVTTAGILFGGLISLVLFGYIRKTRRVGAEQTTVQNALMTRLVDGLASMKPAKIMNGTRYLGDLITADIVALEKVRRRLTILLLTLPQVTEPLVAIALAGGAYYLLTLGGTPLETLMTLGVIFSRAIASVTGIQGNIQTVVASEGGFWFVEGMTQTTAERREASGGQARASLTDAITFDRVSFGHSEKDVLTLVTARIPARQITVIVGPSGTGKTTLIDLIVGLYWPKAGRVLIDDKDLATIALADWRNHIGYVPQEPVLLNDTIRANMTLGRSNISEDDITSALATAGADQFVSALPEGLNTVVGERGGRLSGGQRQRLVLARALARRPALLILDEATASLDSATARDLIKRLSVIAHSTTVIAISHQPEVIRIADQVLFLENGSLRPSDAPDRATAAEARV